MLMPSRRRGSHPTILQRLQPNSFMRAPDVLSGATEDSASTGASSPTGAIAIEIAALLAHERMFSRSPGSLIATPPTSDEPCPFEDAAGRAEGTPTAFVGRSPFS
jgi:hypothetical protein